MDLSRSAQESGWRDYPSEEWDQRKPVNWLHDWSFWEWCATRFADGPILELACGNGRITRQLTLADYSVVAVDVNPHFLNRAIDNVPDTARQHVTFVLQDVVHLALDQTFHLAIMADWAFPAILTQEDQSRFLQNLACHLEPGGIFAFNTLNPEVEQVNLRSDGTWEGGQRRFDVETQIETRRSGLRDVRLRHTTLGEIGTLAHQAGFKICERYGGTDRRPLQNIAGDDLTLILRKMS